MTYRTGTALLPRLIEMCTRRGFRIVQVKVDRLPVGPIAPSTCCRWRARATPEIWLPNLSTTTACPRSRRRPLLPTARDSVAGRGDRAAA